MHSGVLNTGLQALLQWGSNTGFATGSDFECNLVQISNGSELGCHWAEYWILTRFLAQFEYQAAIR